MPLNTDTIRAGASAAGVGAFYTTTIDQSLRFNDGDSPRLSDTFGAGSRTTFTFAAWIKRGNISSDMLFLHSFGQTGFGVEGFIGFTTQNLLSFQFDYNGGNPKRLVSNRFFRDTSSWYHICCVADSTNSTEGNRLRMYINGVRETDFFDEDYPTPSQLGTLNQAYSHYVSGRTNNSSFMDGYLAEVNFLDGVAVTDTNGILNEFIEIKNGICIPKLISGLTYGTNGFRFTFGNSNNVGEDSAGSNDFTATNLVATDIVKDAPTNNFMTFNPLHHADTSSLGNLLRQASLHAHCDSDDGVFTTIEIPRTGKWYIEFCIQSVSKPQSIYFCGNSFKTRDDWTHLANYTSNIFGFSITGSTNRIQRYGDSTILATHSANSIYAFLIDSSAGTYDIYQNDTKILDAQSFTYPTDEGLIFGVGNNSDSGTNDVNIRLNAGQESSFAGIKTGSNQSADANGVGDFFYTTKSGLAICTSNLPDTTLSPNQTEQATDYFDTITYTGSASNQTITTNFQADWLWFKERTTDGIDHNLFDSSRLHSTSSAKFGEKLESNTSDAGADSTAIVSQSTNDITLLGGVSTTNDAYSRTYVMWHWKANGGTTSSNTQGSITSTVQASTKAGFSIVTGTAPSGTWSFGHGLGVTPDMFIYKSRANTENWIVYHKDKTTSVPSNVGIYLNSTLQGFASGSNWVQTVSSLVISITTGQVTGAGDFVCYCLNEIEGFSKFGSYTGNVSTNGTFVYTGFRPAWLMVKRTGPSGTSGWSIFDNKRNTFNAVDDIIQANSSGQESSSYPVDFLSNGFKLRTTDSTHNQNGAPYIFMAFAEQPFKFSNAR